MRHGPAPLTGLSGDFLGTFLENSKPLAPPPDLPGERIGNEITELRQQLSRAGRYDPEQLAGMRERLAGLLRNRAEEELQPAGGGTYRTEKRTFRARIAADGRVELETKRGALDYQDKLMLELGIDPYARAKLAYLDRTRAQRVAVGERYRADRLERSVLYARQNVDRLWATTSDLGARKQGMFELWDDCLETGTKDETTAGASARAYILAIIRARLSGPNAYTPAELLELNAKRQSAEPFAPYDEATPAQPP